MQPIYLLDTNIVSEIPKPRSNAQVIEKISENKNISRIASVAFEEIQEVSALQVENSSESV